MAVDWFFLNDIKVPIYLKLSHSCVSIMTNIVLLADDHIDTWLKGRYLHLIQTYT